MDIGGLQSPDISFWTIWDDDMLLGMGALKRLSADHGEIKSMHTVASMLGVMSAKARGEHMSEATVAAWQQHCLSPSLRLTATVPRSDPITLTAAVPRSDPITLTATEPRSEAKSGASGLA